MPMLYIFSGLPASGKSTLAQMLAERMAAVYLRVDTIEQTLKDFRTAEVTSEGYEVAYRLATDNLRLGLSVVADSCNSIVITRREWERIAEGSNARAVNIETVCSDQAEHRKRVETRSSTVPGLKPPTWKQVEEREYHTWSRGHIVIETSGKSERESFDDLCRALNEAK